MLLLLLLLLGVLGVCRSERRGAGAAREISVLRCCAHWNGNCALYGALSTFDTVLLASAVHAVHACVRGGLIMLYVPVLAYHEPYGIYKTVMLTLESSRRAASDWAAGVVAVVGAVAGRDGSSRAAREPPRSTMGFRQAALRTLTAYVARRPSPVACC